MWKDLNELVSLMERDPGCSMETLYEQCKSWLCEGMGEKISRERKDEEKRHIYIMLAERYEAKFLDSLDN